MKKMKCFRKIDITLIFITALSAIFFQCLQCVYTLPTAKLILTYTPEEVPLKLQKVTSEDDKITWEGLALSPDEKWIAVASAKGTEESVDIYLKNIETPRLIQRSFSPRNEIHLAFSPDGKKLAFSG